MCRLLLTSFARPSSLVCPARPRHMPHTMLDFPVPFHIQQKRSQSYCTNQSGLTSTRPFGPTMTFSFGEGNISTSSNVLQWVYINYCTVDREIMHCKRFVWQLFTSIFFHGLKCWLKSTRTDGGTKEASLFRSRSPSLSWNTELEPYE